MKNLDDKILFEAGKNKYITIPELSLKLKKSEPTIYRHLKKLMEKGAVKRSGSRKTGYWDVL